MKKRTFIKTLVGGSIAMATSNVWMSCAEEKTATDPATTSSNNNGLPSRWIWLRPDLSWTSDEWKAKFAQLRAAGIQAILPQVYASNDTLFDHPTLPVKDRWLERIIPLAHEAGLEVHAWMWTMPLNNPEFIEKHPDWFSVNREGNPSHTHPAYVNYYKFLDPCHPEVQEFVAGNVEALAKIEDLDGVHLDYVRQPDVILAEALQPKYDIVQDKEYPQYDYPYSERCRAQFKAEHGIDPMDLGDEAPKHEAWRQFRYDAVSNVVNNHCVPMARKYGKKITAAVFPNWESVRQQWHHWDLDGFLPMLYQGFYNEDIPWIAREVAKAKTRLKNAENPKPVYSGLFMPHVSAEDLERTINLTQASGANGWSLFDMNSVSDAHWEVLRGMYG